MAVWTTPPPDLVDHGREPFDILGALEAAQKIARRGRVRYAAGSHQPSHCLAPLQRPLVLQARAVGIQCIRQRQHVVRLVIRRMPRKQPQALIEALRNPKTPHELLRQHQATVVRHLAPRIGIQMQQRMAHHTAPGLGPGQLLGIHTGPPIDVTGALECDRYFHLGALALQVWLLLGRSTYTSSQRAFPILFPVAILFRAYFRTSLGLTGAGLPPKPPSVKAIDGLIAEDPSGLLNARHADIIRGGDLLRPLILRGTKNGRRN